MKYAFLLVFWAFLGVEDVFSQPEIEWQRSLGGTDGDEANSVIQTRDGGYAVVGVTYSLDGDIFGHHGAADYWVVKLDINGGLEWKRAYGGSDFDEAKGIIQTSDDGYVMVGITYSNNWDVSGQHGGGDMWVVKVGVDGAILWQRALGGSGRDYGYSVKQTVDGGYIVAGYTESSDGDVTAAFGEYDYWAVKLDNIGNIEWQRSYGGSGRDICSSIKQTSDGGYILAGQSISTNGHISNPIGSIDYWVVKLNFEGKIEWEKSLGGTGSDLALDIVESTDGGFVVLGQVGSYNSGQVMGSHGYLDMWVAKLSEEGELMWAKSIGGSSYDYAGSISLTQDGGYMIFGQTFSSNGDVSENKGGSDYWIVKTNEFGEIQWQKTVGGSQGDDGNCAQQTADGGFITVGYSWSNNGDVTQNKGKSDFWIVKLSKETTPTQELPTQTLQIYPNPANKTIHLQIPNSSSEPLEITLFSPAGQEMRRFSAQSSAGVDVSGLPVGVYSVRARTLEGVVYLGRFTKF